MSLSTRHEADMRSGPDFPEYAGEYFAVFPSYANDDLDVPRYLVTFDKGVGDGVTIGLSAVEQIIENDAAAYGAIDVLCNEVQSDLFRYDPRINRIIQTPLAFYPSPERASWPRLFRPEAKAADEMASCRLYQALAARDPERVCCLPAQPRLGLLETAALLDGADVLVTGDTGVMHLAVAQKKIAQGGPGSALLRNNPRVVALFGGTNPGFYGYPSRSVILGRGRKEQRKFRPGFSKEGYDPGRRDLFDHIAACELSETVARLLVD